VRGVSGRGGEATRVREGVFREPGPRWHFLSSNRRVIATRLPLGCIIIERLYSESWTTLSTREGEGEAR
jgi:hypothetical protein